MNSFCTSKWYTFWYVLATLGSVMIPFIHHFITSDTKFSEDFLLHKQIILAIPIGTTYWINLSMFSFFKKMVFQKMMCTKQVLAMMDTRFNTKENFYGCLPKVNINCTWNQQSMLNMLIFFKKHNQVHFTRGLLFTTLIVMTYSIQFLYISFHVIVMQMPILEIGGPVFVMYGIYNFVVVIFNFLSCLLYAAEVNDSYDKMLALLHNKTREVAHVQLLASYGLIMLLNEEDSKKRQFRLDQRFHILKEVVKKNEVRYLSLRNNKLYKTTDLFIDVSDQVDKRCESLNNVIGQVMSHIENIIEKERLEFLGQPITQQLIQEIVVLILTLLVGILQGLYDSDD